MVDITTPPAIAGLPQPVPQRGGSQPNFTSRGNAFVDALPTLISDINSAMTWIKESYDAASTLGSDLNTDVTTALTDIDTAKNNALSTLRGVLDQIEGIQLNLGDPEADITGLRDRMIDDINTAKQAALDELEAKCGGGA